MNYLQVPAGTGEGVYYDFDFTDFTKKFKLDTQLVLYSVKALEQEELLAFNEQVFLSSRIIFTANRETLEAFEKGHPQLDPMVKALLRTYGGILDYPVPVSEKLIANVLRRPSEKVITELQELHTLGIIEYDPQKDKPQLYFIRNRVRADELHIDAAGYEKRKKQMIARIDAFLRYAGAAEECRSAQIALYFGDAQVPDCGICDNCLARKNAMITEEEFGTIHQQFCRPPNQRRFHFPVC